MTNENRPYNLLVPIKLPIEKLDTWGKAYADLAARIGAELFIIVNNVFGDRAEFLKRMDELKLKVDFFRKRGVSVGAWLCPTTGHEGMGLTIGKEGESFTRREVLDCSSGKARLIRQAFCPLDDGFVRDFAWKMGELCKTGVTRSLFEDDLRLSGPPITKIACCCKLHMDAYAKRLGRAVELDGLRDLIYENRDLRYRREWMELKRETMTSFLRALREEVDKYNPDFRIGISASRLNYDIDGATVQELARAAAGKTKPFVRLTGAPYWARENNTLSSVIESNRMQFGWFDGSGIEIISEGDPYPRPRSRIPAAYLETFDQILRASGGSDGIYKYVTAYGEGPGYEDGYIDFHVKNQRIYKLIDKLFAGKRATGLTPRIKQQKLADAVFDELEPFEEFGSYYRLDSVIPPEAYLVTDCSVPTSYEECGYAGIAFGENARHLPDSAFKNGIITDLKGASILMQRGIDVGLIGYTRVNANPSEEYFHADGTAVAIGQPSPFPLRFYRAELRDGAAVISSFRYGDELPQFGGYNADVEENASRESFPSCYLYENADGQRFCVYTFVALNVQNRDIYNGFSGDFFTSYCRQRQIFDAAEWLQGRRLPAASLKNPHLYVLCAEDEYSRVIGLWNIHEDEILNPELELDSCEGEISFYETEGFRNGTTVRLTRPLKPYECAFIEIRKQATHKAFLGETNGNETL